MGEPSESGQVWMCTHWKKYLDVLLSCQVDIKRLKLKMHCLELPK